MLIDWHVHINDPKYMGSRWWKHPVPMRVDHALDAHCLVGLDHIDETGERRWHAIGAIQIEPGHAVVLLVVHAYREDRNGEEIIRIISARRAEKPEIRRYQKQTMD